MINEVMNRMIAHHEREVVCDSSGGHGQTRGEAEKLHRVLRSEAVLERHGVGLYGVWDAEQSELILMTLARS